MADPNRPIREDMTQEVKNVTLFIATGCITLWLVIVASLWLIAALIRWAAA